MHTQDSAQAADEPFVTGDFSCRLLTGADVPFVTELYQQPSRMRFIGGVQSMDSALSGAERMVKHNKKATQSAYWLIEHRQSQRPFGLQGVSAIKGLSGIGEIGIVLAEHGEGQGLPAQLLSAMFSHVFITMGLDYVMESHQANHTVINRLSKRLGFANYQKLVRYAQPYTLGVLAKSHWLAKSC